MEKLDPKVEKKQRQRLFAIGTGRIDLPFFLLAMLLLVVGLVTLYSASYATAFDETGNSAYYVTRQAVFAVMGVVIIFLISRFNYQKLKLAAFPLLVAAVVLLVLVLVIGTTKNNATRWLRLGPILFQPSEIAKLAVIVCFATLISRFKEKMQTFRYGIIPFVLILAVIAGLVVLEPHISATVIIFAVGAVLMLIGGVKLGWFVGAFAVLGTAGYFVASKMEHVQQRLAVWKDPWIDELGSGFQSIQSLYAIGSGGLLGLGLGNSRQKFYYLPEEFNDYIFAIICEELGFIGAMMILLLFALFIIRGFWLAMHTRDRFGSLLISGIMTMFALQVFLNIAVVTTLITATGISLPFFSYGGTALIIQMAEVGVVLAVSRQNVV